MVDEGGLPTLVGKNQIILYEGSPLEVISNSSIVLSGNSLMEQKRFYLASDVIVGRYGVTGFVIVDNRPEKRWVSYTDGSYSGVTYKPKGYLGSGIEDKSRFLSHFVDTDTGFKMIRYFILPENIKEFFKRDEYLGDPMITKCCEQDTLPKEFDEVKATLIYLSDNDQNLLKEIIRYISGGLKHIDEHSLFEAYYGHWVYFSFHPWQVYSPVIKAGEEGVIRSIRNFDNFLERFDRNAQLKKRDLQIETAQEYKGMLQIPN